MLQNRTEDEQHPHHETEPTEHQSTHRAATPSHPHQHQRVEDLHSPIDRQDIPENPLNNQIDTTQAPVHWFQSWSKVLSPVAWLENKSSVARDHLANERTFLAWFRTSLSLTSIGIALVQLSRLAKQIKVAQVRRLITSIQPSIEPLSHPSLSSNALNNFSDPTDQSSSIQSTLIQINQNLVNLQSSIDLINRHVDSISRTKSLASLIGNCYVCIGLVFLFIGTRRYFHVQQVLQTGQFPHSRRSIGVTTFIVSALSVITAVGMFRSSF